MQCCIKSKLKRSLRNLVVLGSEGNSSVKKRVSIVTINGAQHL